MALKLGISASSYRHPLLPALLPLALVSLAAAARPSVAQTPAASAEAAAALAPLFTDAERAAIVAYWNAPGRYTVGATLDATIVGPWQIRLTPEGSKWLLAYQKAIRGQGKVVPPTADAHAAAGSPQDEWERWVTTRVAWDRYQAARARAAANAAVGKLGMPLPDAPPAPGPIPAGLLAACGNPPSFASAVTPLQYRVTFDDGEAFPYRDNTKLRERYAYYRFPQGTASEGQSLRQIPQAELDSLFQEAGFTPSEQKAFSEVSGLEGGFETINTYDTGYVSVGFIQFITSVTGSADLTRVLQREKTDAPEQFERDFHRYGIDVQPGPDGTVVVIDPSTGAELSGRDAVYKMIDDKRLVAIFQRAGRHSRPFRVEQIKEARASYWPTDDPVTATLPDGTTVRGKVSDVIKSEAGLATLVDRKVNTGNIRILNDAVSRCMAAHGCKTLGDCCAYEREIVEGIKYRRDFLAVATLGQPPALTVTPAAPAPTTP